MTGDAPTTVSHAFDIALASGFLIDFTKLVGMAALMIDFVWCQAYCVITRGAFFTFLSFFEFSSCRIICLVEQRVSVLIVGILVAVSVYLGDILRLIPVAALYGMFIYLGLNGLMGLDSVNTLKALLTRRKYWGRWEFLTNLPLPQLAVIILINFGELAILIVFIVVAEFTTAGYIAMATPIILIGSGLVREFLLPKWSWLAPSLEKVGNPTLIVCHVNHLETDNQKSNIQKYYFLKIKF